MALTSPDCCMDLRISALGFLWKEWCQSWNSGTLATSFEELTHWKRLWRWEGLEAGGEGDDPGWDGWMASLTQWTRVWASSGRWWRTAWFAAVHGTTKSRTRLRHWTTTETQGARWEVLPFSPHPTASLWRLTPKGRRESCLLSIWGAGGADPLVKVGVGHTQHLHVCFENMG